MLHILFAAPKPIQIGDREYKVGALKLAELALLHRWIADHYELPSVALRRTIDLLPESERSLAVAKARVADEDGAPAPGTVAGNTILFRSPDGQMEFLRVFLGKHQAVMEDELATLASHLSEEDFGVFVALAFGDDDLDPTAARAAVEERLKAMADLQDAAARALAGGLSLPGSGAEETALPASPSTSSAS